MNLPLFSQAGYFSNSFTANRISRFIFAAGSLTALSVAMNSAHAGGLEYTKQSILPFFEPGNYAELSYAYVDLNPEGTDAAGNKIDDMFDDFNLPGAAIKIAPTPNSALALIYETPFGVDIEYPKGNIFNNSLGTSEGRIDTTGITLLGGGKITDNIWLYGGVEYQTLKGKVTGAQPVGTPAALSNIIANFGLPTMADYSALVEQKTNGTISADDAVTLEAINQLAGTIAETPIYYTLDFEDESTLSPVIGIAYEKPEIALRAALTYRAPAKYNVTGIESLQTVNPVAVGGDGITLVPVIEGIEAPVAGKSEVNFPQSVNFDFQTGLSEKYQLLGMVNVRWVDWSAFKVTPPLITTATQEPLDSYEDDSYAIEVALGKQFNPKLSGEVRVGYERGTGAAVSLLGPYNDIKTLALSAQYKLTEQLVVSASGQYLWLEGGPVETKIDGLVADIDDGTGYALGMKVGYYF